MKTFVSHQPQVTIRNCSLMLLPAIYHRPAIRQAEKTHSSDRKNLFDKRLRMVFLLRG